MRSVSIVIKRAIRQRDRCSHPAGGIAALAAFPAYAAHCGLSRTPWHLGQGVVSNAAPDAAPRRFAFDLVYFGLLLPASASTAAQLAVEELRRRRGCSQPCDQLARFQRITQRHIERRES